MCVLAILGMGFVTACTQATSLNATQASITGNVTTTFAHMQSDQGIDYQKLAAAFHQQNPSITVTVIPVDHSVQLADADIAKQADVIFLTGTNPATLPGFLALEPLLETATNFSTNDLWPGSLAACSDDRGNTYGIPLTMYQQGVYYAPAIFDRDHLAYPQPGWTWSQLEQLVTQLGGVSNDLPLYGLVDGPDGTILDPLIAAQLPSGSNQVDARAMAASLAWYVQLAKDQKLYPMQPAFKGALQLDKMNTLLNNNQAAMWIDSPSLTGGNRQGVYLPYPVENPTDHTTPVGANCGAVSAGTKNRQAAWTWLAFLSRQDLSGDKANSLLPGRQSLANVSPYWASLTDVEKSAMQFGLEHAWYYPPGLGDTPFYVLQAIASAIQSGTDLATALHGVAASTGSSTLPTSTTEPVMVNTLQATLPPDVQTISFNASYWTGSVDPTTALKPQIAAFEKTHPEIKVKLVTGFSIPDDGNAFRKLATDYDCFEFPSPDQFLQSLSDNDLLDLTRFMDANISVKDDFYSAFFKPFQKDGKLYGLPTGTTIQYIAYNEDLLTKLGLPFPASGWTFEEMMALATKAANPSASTPTYGLGATPDSLLAAAGVHWYDSTVQPPHALFNSDEVAKGLAWLTQLYKQGTLYWLADYMNYNKAILNGQVALWVTSGFETYDSYGNGNITVQNLPFKVGYIPGPTLSSGAVFSYPPVSFGFYISSHTKYPQACWDWIQYLSDQPSVFSGYTPRKTILEKEAVGLNPDQFAAIRASIEQYQNSDYVYIDLLNPLIGPYTTKRIQVEIAVLQGEDIATVLAEAQRNADAYMSCISQKNLTGLDTLQISKLVQSCNDSTKITPQP